MSCDESFVYIDYADVVPISINQISSPPPAGYRVPESESCIVIDDDGTGLKDHRTNIPSIYWGGGPSNSHNQIQSQSAITKTSNRNNEEEDCVIVGVSIEDDNSSCSSYQHLPGLSGTGTESVCGPLGIMQNRYAAREEEESDLGYCEGENSPINDGPIICDAPTPSCDAPSLTYDEPLPSSNFSSIANETEGGFEPTLSFTRKPTRGHRRPFYCPECRTVCFDYHEHEQPDEDTTNMPKTKIYSCKFCGQTFDKAGVFLRHCRNCEYRTQCQYCELVLPDKKSLEDHLNYVHNEHEHPEMPENPSQNIVMEEHPVPQQTDELPEYEDEDQSKQSKSGKEFKKSNLPSISLSTKNSNTRKPKSSVKYTCEYCGRKMVYLSTYQKHLKTHRSKKQNPSSTCTTSSEQHRQNNKDVGQKTQRKATNSVPIVESTIKYTCPHCSFDAKCSASFRRHLKIHDGHSTNQDTATSRCPESSSEDECRIIECQLCKLILPDSNSLNEHFQKVHNPNSEEQQEGFKEFNVEPLESNNEVTNVQEHQSTNPMLSVKYTCPHCDLEVINLTNFYSHLKTHVVITENKIKKEPKRQFFECSECGLKLTSLTNLNRHTKEHKVLPITCNPNEPSSKRLSKKYQCPECGIKLTSLKNFKRHSKTHANLPKTENQQVNKKRGKQFKCSDCDQKLSSFKNLKRHLKSHQDLPKHENHSTKKKKKKFECIECGRTFSAFKNLKRHQKTHSRDMVDDIDEESLDTKIIDDLEQDKLKCPDCGRGFWYEINLERHRAVHSDKTLYRCQVCYVNFVKQEHLQDHFEKFHLDE
ncbi:zinc finger protein 184 [Patella vulgata]|uniref:zinc finger protein 184 n=1 Tax=Patella vulgata TaxID=6465 RepID=UPI00217FF64D|nr:zinc finger protein 184 [Patella vulgata]XP_050391866.1 zinc finger protein 184 [Patella vulgata]